MKENERTVLPSNIKQVGTLSDGKRVYVEDYASTYLQQYANADNCREKAAFLVGREITADGGKALFISGVIRGRYTVQKNGIVQLSEKSWQYAKKQMDIYFEGLDIVGWVYVQAGYEDSIKEGVRKYHEENSERGLQVMLLMDPAEKINSFFVSGENGLEALKGYIIYYEKNEGMHEYMLENKLKPANEDYRLISEFDFEDEQLPETESVFENSRMDERKNARALRKAGKKESGLMSALSFVMLMVCFVMGAGLVQNDKRINELELSIATLERELDNGTQSVFAADNSIVYITETATAETTSETTTETETQTDKESESEPETIEYRVQSGDTLSHISEKIYGTIGMVEDIMQLNGIEDANDLTEGMELVLPK